jgi:hypothetical protein
MAVIEVGSLYAAKWAIKTKTHVIKQVLLWERQIRHPREQRRSKEQAVHDGGGAVCTTGNGGGHAADFQPTLQAHSL